jgi:hypothetical protein
MVTRSFKILEDEDSFEDLYDYFYQIDYILEQGDEFFYFSRNEKNAFMLQSLLMHTYDSAVRKKMYVHSKQNKNKTSNIFPLSNVGLSQFICHGNVVSCGHFFSEVKHK